VDGDHAASMVVGMFRFGSAATGWGLLFAGLLIAVVIAVLLRSAPRRPPGE
jgi:hypothetical protein